MSASRTRQLRPSASMSGMWKRSRGWTLRYRQTKGAANNYVQPTATAPHLDPIELSQIERTELRALLISGGKPASGKLKRAQILFAADAGDEENARSVGVSGLTRRSLVEGNPERALREEPRPLPR